MKSIVGARRFQKMAVTFLRSIGSIDIKDDLYAVMIETQAGSLMLKPDVFSIHGRFQDARRACELLNPKKERGNKLDAHRFFHGEALFNPSVPFSSTVNSSRVRSTSGIANRNRLPSAAAVARVPGRPDGAACRKSGGDSKRITGTEAWKAGVVISSTAITLPSGAK